MMDKDEIIDTSDPEEYAQELEERARKIYANTKLKSRSFDAHQLDQGLSPPPKKRKYHHNYGDSQISSPSNSESINGNSHRRSPSFSTTFVTTSPGLLSTSRSPTRTPSHPGVLYITKNEAEDGFLDIYPRSENSQDSLLLISPPRPLPSTPTTPQTRLPHDSPRPSSSHNTPKTYTPVDSPPGPRVRVPFPGHSPLAGVRSSPSRTPLSVRNDESWLTSPRNVYDEKDDHLSFTPTKETKRFSNSSPTGPTILDSPGPSSPIIVDNRQSSQFGSQIPLFLNGANPLPSSRATTEEPMAKDDDSVALAQSLVEGPRYSLRTRKPAQLQPYTVESVMYKHQLRTMPEAIVKNKSLGDHIHRDPTNRYEEEAGTQQDDYVDDGTQVDNDPWEETERRRKRRWDVSPTPSVSEHQTRYPGILQGFPDDDDDEEMRATAREAHKYRKRMEKEKKAQEREERKRKHIGQETKKAKRIPTSVSENDKESSNIPRFPDHMDALRDYFQADYEVSDGQNEEEHENHSILEPPQFSSPPPDNTLRIFYEDAIPVDFEEDGDTQMQQNEQDQHAKSRSHSVASDPDIVLDLEPKKKTILHKMMPAFMINKLAKESTDMLLARQKQKRQEHSRNSVDPDTLLPGQTRVQMTANPKPIREIKGDSESEVELDISSDSDSSSDPELDTKGTEAEDDPNSDVNDILFVYQRPNSHMAHEQQVIDLTNDTYPDSDGPRPAFAHVGRYKPRRKEKGERLRDPSAIDYMLARSTKTGRNGRSSNGRMGASHRKQSKFTHDIVTGGARKMGRERQTLLSFSADDKRHHKSSKRSSRKQNNASVSRSDPMDEDSFEEFGNESDHQANHVVPVDKPTRKQRKKMKEKRVKELGVYTFRSEDRGIVSGRRPGPVYITVDLEDDGFHRTLERKVSGSSPEIDWSKHYQPPLVIRKLKPLGSIKATEAPSSSSHRVSSKAENASDLGIPVFYPGKSFAPSTYIKRGWLYDLINVNSNNTQNAPTMPATRLLDFRFDAEMGVEDFHSMLPKLGEDLFDFATGLPDPDIEDTILQWSSVMRIVSQLTSWYLKDSVSEETLALVNVIQTQFTQLINRIENTSISIVDTPILSTVWFALEISVRARQHPNPAFERELKRLSEKSTSLLVRLLTQYGLDQTMQPFLDGVELDGTSLAHYSAELWVCLMHLLGAPSYDNIDPKNHRFWTMLKDTLIARAELKKTRTPYEASEDAWLTIYSVCALSQFSVHGMTISQPHLPTYWDIVIFALRRINLNPNFDKVAETSRRKYDKYVALIVNRIFHLWDRYKWNLGDPVAIQVFNELSPIFTSRKHANLLHERDEYPAFFRDANWDRLSLNCNETAYTLFMKLIVQAIQDGNLSAIDQTAVKFGKLLRIMIPMADLTFTEPQGQEITMFYNRMAALAIASDLDRNSLDERVQKAQSYLNFAKVNTQTRQAIIRGMANWGCLLVQRKMNVGSFEVWIERIAQTLVNEFSASPSADTQAHQPTEKSKKLALEHLTCSLFNSVRKIIQSCAEYSCYPEPCFLKSLKVLYGSHKAMNFNARDNRACKEFVLLLNAYLDARSKASPNPRRPPLHTPQLTSVDEDSQDSQDFGSMDAFLEDVDWEGANIPELATSSNSSTEQTENELRFRKVLESLPALKWVTLSGLKPYLVFPGRKRNSYLCDLWIRARLGLAAIEATKPSWEDAYKRIDDELSKCDDEQWSRRVQLSIMFQTLRLDPMRYSDFMGRAFGVFLKVLISDTTVLYEEKADDPTVERAYVSFVLSIDGRHPLLLNAATLPPKDTSGDYELTAEQFLALRIPLLRGIFKNLNELICQGRIGRPEVPLDVQCYINLCRDMLSSMRNNLHWMSNSPDKQTKYRDLCLEILAILKENRELCEIESMHFWTTWCP